MVEPCKICGAKEEPKYDRMELALPKGMKAEIAERVKEGKADSNNAYVVAAVREKMEREV